VISSRIDLDVIAELKRRRLEQGWARGGGALDRHREHTIRQVQTAVFASSHQYEN
jgi:hypothetical protein